MLNVKELQHSNILVRSRCALYGVALTTTALLGANAQAVEYRLSTGLTSTHSDNITRANSTNGEERDDWIHTPMLRGELAHETGNFRVQGDYLVEHRIYAEDSFEDRTRWTGRADLRWDTLQDVLQINASNSRTESTEDALGQDVELNRQVVTVSSIGPKLQFRPRASDVIYAEYRYSDISQEETDSDSTRQLLAAGYELGLSENRSISFEVSRDKVDFSRDLSPELEIDTASLTYESKGDALDFSLRGGYTTIDRSLDRDKVDGIIGRVDLTWRVSGNGQIQVNGSRSINDQSDDVLRGSAQFGQGSVFQNTNVNEVFTEDTLDVRYIHRWGRNRATIGYRLQNQDFQDNAATETFSRDQDESGFSALYARRVTPRIDFRVAARLIERDFQERGLVEDFLSANARIDWQASRRVNLFTSVSYEERDGRGDPMVVNALSFDEFRFSFGISIDLLNRTQRRQQL